MWKCIQMETIYQNRASQISIFHMFFLYKTLFFFCLFFFFLFFCSSLKSGTTNSNRIEAISVLFRLIVTPQNLFFEVFLVLVNIII